MKEYVEYHGQHTGAQIDEILGKATSISNPNLLDNWYWADPDSIIDQRGGYVVPPGVDYYSLTDSTVAGKTTGYVKVDAISVDGYSNALITFNGVSYYVKKGNYVRGYVGEGYTIDRWRLGGTSSIKTYIVSDRKLVAESNAGRFAYIEQLLDNPSRFAGQKMTLSALAKGECSDWIIQMWLSRSGSSTQAVATSGNWSGGELKSVTFNFPVDAVDTDRFRIIIQTRYTLQPYAAKLELGDTQTLARKDENGNWVLIDPPPNRQQELAKCQRYHTVYEGYSFLGFGIIEYNHICQFAVPTPSTMRLGTVSVSAPNGIKLFDGKTGYDGTIFESHASCNAGSAKMVASFPDAPVSTGGYVRLDSGQKLILDANL